VAENEKPEEAIDVEQPEKPVESEQPVATEKKAAPVKKSTAKKKSTTKKKVATKKRAAPKKKAVPKKSAATLVPATEAAVVAGSDTTSAEAVTVHAAEENREKIQQRLEALGVTPTASRKEHKATLDDRLFTAIMLAGLLFIGSILIYEFWVKSSPSLVTEEQAAMSLPDVVTSQPATVSATKAEAVPDESEVVESSESSQAAVSLRSNGPEGSVGEITMSDVATTSADESSGGEMERTTTIIQDAGDKAGKESTASTEAVIEAADATTPVPADDKVSAPVIEKSAVGTDMDTEPSQGQSDIAAAPGMASERVPAYPPHSGYYYPVPPPPYGYYPPSPWWPPYLPY
jgi:hypothetical protein